MYIGVLDEEVLGLGSSSGVCQFLVSMVAGLSGLFSGYRRILGHSLQIRPTSLDHHVGLVSTLR